MSKRVKNMLIVLMTAALPLLVAACGNNGTTNPNGFNPYGANGYNPYGNPYNNPYGAYGQNPYGSGCLPGQPCQGMMSINAPIAGGLDNMGTSFIVFQMTGAGQTGTVGIQGNLVLAPGRCPMGPFINGGNFPFQGQGSFTPTGATSGNLNAQIQVSSLGMATIYGGTIDILQNRTAPYPFPQGVPAGFYIKAGVSIPQCGSDMTAW